MLPEDKLPFSVLAEDGAARAGLLSTTHGVIATPAFMPVGTQGSVKTLSQGDLRGLGVSILLANAYHLYLRPGIELIADAGGLHGFMGWDRAILTDSGGFQVFSLKGLTRVKNGGVHFQSHIDGSYHFLTPENVTEIEHSIGADIIMTFDECLTYPATIEKTRQSCELTLDWAERCRRRHDGLAATGQALFGIVQGGTYPELRSFCADRIVDMQFDGYAVGGLAVGEPKSVMHEMIDITVSRLPQASPRYLMGVGLPEDLVDGVARGIDMFDCVIPTRNARNGTVFTRFGRMPIKAARYAADRSPIDPQCGCEACRCYTRSYIRHLFHAGEMLAMRLATTHNIFFFMNLMREMRQAILEQRFDSAKERFLQTYHKEQE